MLVTSRAPLGGGKICSRAAAGRRVSLLARTQQDHRPDCLPGTRKLSVCVHVLSEASSFRQVSKT